LVAKRVPLSRLARLIDNFFTVFGAMTESGVWVV